MEDKKILTSIELSSLAGKARAEKLSPERRREIAVQASHARHYKDSLKATHDGSLEICGTIFDCYVLKTGERIISTRKFRESLGLSEMGSEEKKMVSGGKLPYFMLNEAIRPYLPEEFHRGGVLFEFITKNRKKAFGLDAKFLPVICESYLKARDNNTLPEKQMKTAKQAEMIIRSLAKVGIIALIDEATGYQEERARDELQTLLKKFISDELLAWVSTFPHEFFRQAYKLHGWKYQEGNCKHPQCMSQFINKFVYDAISPEVRKELQSKNPFNPDTNCNKHKHHQFLSKEYGRPALERHLMTIIGLMKASRHKEEFEELFNRVFKGISQMDWINQFIK